MIRGVSSISQISKSGDPQSFPQNEKALPGGRAFVTIKRIYLVAGRAGGVARGRAVGPVADGADGGGAATPDEAL